MNENDSKHTSRTDWEALDTEVITWFKEKNVDYKTAINSVLRSYIEHN